MIAIRDLTPPQARLMTALVEADAANKTAVYHQQVHLLGRDLSEALDRIRDLEAEVAALTRAALAPRPIARPTVETRVIEWRPDHRRLVDGGRHVRGQRRVAGVSSHKESTA